VGRVWRIRRVEAFRPKGHGFDYRSSRHVRASPSLTEWTQYDITKY